MGIVQEKKTITIKNIQKWEIMEYIEWEKEKIGKRRYLMDRFQRIFLRNAEIYALFFI